MLETTAGSYALRHLPRYPMNIDAGTTDRPLVLIVDDDEEVRFALSELLLSVGLDAEFDLSVSHFSRAFRISTGLPPHQWLLRRRVEAAQQLMTVRDLPLSEIAISAGFANQSHFTRVFSAVVGVGPGAWRREARGVREGEA